MNRALEQTPLGTFDQETVEQHATSAVEQAKVCCPKRELVNASGPHLAKEMRAVPRLRLRAAAVILLIGFGVFLVRHAVSMILGYPLGYPEVAQVMADFMQLRCLAKRPEERFQDTGSLEQALAECAAADQWTQAHAARWWQENDETGPSESRINGRIDAWEPIQL